MREDFQMIAGGCVERILHCEILGKRDVAAFEIGFHVMRVSIADLHRILLARDLEILQGVRGVEFQLNPEMPGGLCAIRIRPERNRQQGFQPLHWEILLIFHFKALGSESMDPDRSRLVAVSRDRWPASWLADRSPRLAFVPELRPGCA